MYATMEKKGKLIAVWSDAIGVGAVSTTAALVAAGLASKEKSTLILSTDKGPYDGVAISSDLAVENLMDDLVILASSGGIRSEADFTPYVQKLSDFLSCLKGSNEFNKISVSATEAIHRILDMALYLYDFVVVDVYGERSAISDQIIQDADLVLCCISQNRKHMSRLVSEGIFSSYLEDKTAMLIVTKYQIYDFLTLKQMEKLLGAGGFYTLSEDDEIHKAVCSQNVADYVFKNINGASKGILIKKHMEPSIPMEELNVILNDIIELFTEEEEDEPKSFFGRKKEKEQEHEQKAEMKEEKDDTPPEDRPEPPSIKNKKKKKGE